jgi:hypothetical protein
MELLPWLRETGRYRLARGATNRVPCHCEPALIVLVCWSPAVGAASEMSSAST